MKVSVFLSSKTKSRVENTMHTIFFVCGLVAVAAVVLISAYMIVSGGPAIAKIGPLKFLLGQVWNPEADEFGILPMILSSIFATAIAILIAVPVGLLVSVFLNFISGNKTARFLTFLVELLAGIPSVVYGLLGSIIIVPLVFNIQKLAGLPASGSLITASIVLVIMILPTIISITVSSLKEVPKQYYDASLALGGSEIQTIFKVMIPAAKSGIASGVVLGVGRAIGETMAVMMVAGNAAIMPDVLKPARLLTVGISLEWAYSSGLHREALYGIGLVLFVFIMLINIILNIILKRGGEKR